MSHSSLKNQCRGTFTHYKPKAEENITTNIQNVCHSGSYQIFFNDRTIFDNLVGVIKEKIRNIIHFMEA